MGLCKLNIDLYIYLLLTLLSLTEFIVATKHWKTVKCLFFKDISENLKKSRKVVEKEYKSVRSHEKVFPCSNADVTRVTN